MIDHDNLEEFADSVRYDIGENDAGIAFYATLAQETGDPILELACGTGRVSIPIARLGLAVTGLDIVPAMVERAGRKSDGLPIRWVVGDARTFDLGERFRLIFLTGNAFQMFLTLADQEALFERVRAHLHADGLFAFETRNPLWDTPLTRADPGRTLERSRLRGDFVPFLEDRTDETTESDAGGRRVRRTHARTYDPVAQIMHLTNERRWREGGQERTTVTRLALRFTFPQELAALLHYNGFTVERRYGDWDGQALTAASPSIIVICRARA